MSTDADGTGDNGSSPPVKISLSLGESGALWVARDEETGVASQGPTCEDALENLDEAVVGYHGKGEPPSDDDLRELGIDPEDNTSGELHDIFF
ncbi:type II toxin-antitoxin system HicB family antitoxin [Natrinema halophilum]|uniref:type II toxin-antitoxin system HicB family antitoxin n=1 Tax=Natrinema halophilum TaxID=1699371 RepID=UPI001F2A0C09|nr:type II toxin-antitoxin system HicB family antitoxin [Natrinema halophilum]UHQ96434.1 type II toxin-antitoxin system HicB family antitoxin [Natrinema halophilum]